MTMLRWDPKAVDLSPGLAALSDAVDSTNAAKQRRREAERQRLQDIENAKYKQAENDHLLKIDSRADEEAKAKRSNDESEATLKIMDFLGQGPGGLAKAKALAGSRGASIDEGQSAPMPKLQLDDPTVEAPPVAGGGLAGMFKLRNPSVDAPPPMSANPDAPDVGYARPTGLAGLLNGKKLAAGPDVAPPSVEPATPAKAADWGDQTREWDKAETANPFKAGTYKYRGKDGNEIIVDPSAGKDYERQQKEEEGARQAANLESAAENEPNAATKQALLTEAARLRAAIPGASAQHLRNREGQEDSQSFQAGQDKTYRLTAEQQMEVRRRQHAGAGGGGKPITPDQKLDNDRQNASLADNMLNQHLSREEYKDTRKALSDTKTLLTGLESNNVAAQRAALGVWAKNAAGPGTVQQSERDEFVNSVGGKDMAIRKKALEWLSGGEVPEAQLKIFVSAARDITMRQQMERLGAIQDDVRDMFASHPNDTMRSYADWAANRVGRQYMPHASGGGSVPQGQPATAPAAGGGQREKLLEYARRNPEDPRSKVIIQKFGGAP